MSRHERSLDQGYFDRLYEEDADPWRFATSAYEREKYVSTLAALPKSRYANAIEIGCSIGVFTKQLASRCDRLVAIDVSEKALNMARRRCAGETNVRFARIQIPADWPDGMFNLILLSEVVYYLDRADVEALVARVTQSLAPDGNVVLVHWLGETHYPLTGDEAADLFIQESTGPMQLLDQTRTDDYRLDVLRAAAGREASGRTGGDERI